MKIAYIHYIYGREGAHHHARQFAEAVGPGAQRMSVHALNLAQPPNGRSLRSRLRATFKEKLSRYLHEPKEVLWNPRYVMQLLRIVRRERPDVLLVRSHNLTFAEAVVRAITGVPLVLEVNAPASESTMYFDEYIHIPGAARLTEAIKVRRADAIIAVSEALREHLIAMYRVPPEKITANPNGADCQLFHPGVDGSGVRERYNLENHLVVGFVGHFKPWHGLEFMGDIIASIDRPSVRFLLVGGEETRNQEHNLLAKCRCNERVILTGRVPHEEVPQYLAAMDVTLMPHSNFYGSPLKVIEYMAAGKSLVAPRYGPLEEIIEHGTEGMLFEPLSLSGAVECIEALLADAGLRRRLGQNARRRVTEGLTWQHNAEKVIAVCRRVAERRDVTPATRRKNAGGR